MKTFDLVLELLKSKTVIGIITMVLGFVIKDNPQLVEQLSTEGVELISAALASIGALVAAWGRMTAKGPMVKLIAPAAVIKPVPPVPVQPQ